MSTLLRSAVIAGVLAAPVASQAAAPTVSDVLKASGITESGYIAAGFNYNNRQFNSAPLSYGDANDMSFTLNQVGLMFSMTPSSGFGGVLDILGAHDAAALTTDGGGDIVIKQAYAQYSSGAITVMGGRFVTLAGSEVIAATGNSNVTRSLLFGLQPLTHTGVRAAFKAGPITVTGGLNNTTGMVPFGCAGTDGGFLGFTAGCSSGVANDNNEQKTVELSVAFAPMDTLSVALTGYKGQEANPGQGVSVSPLLIDLVASLQLTKALSLGLNFDHRSDDNVSLVNAQSGPGSLTSATKYDGFALYGNVQLTDTFRAGVRAEYLAIKNGLFAPGLTAFPLNKTQKQKEITLTGAYAAASNFDLVTDLRYDKDDGDYAVSGFSIPNHFNGKGSMTSLVVSGVYKF